MDALFDIDANGVSTLGHDTNETSTEETIVKIPFDRVISSHQ